MNDNLGKMLNQIKNANLTKRQVVFIPYTLDTYLILKVLIDESFIDSISVVNKKSFDPGDKESIEMEENIEENIKKTPRYIKVYLRYSGQEKKSAINNISRFSKPSLRVYAKYKNIPHILNGLGLIIMSTSKGIMTSKDAYTSKIGGELLFSIW